MKNLVNYRDHGLIMWIVDLMYTSVTKKGQDGQDNVFMTKLSSVQTFANPFSYPFRYKMNVVNLNSFSEFRN